MARKIIHCENCKDKKLSKDEIAINKKYRGREISEFYCLNCLAYYLECDVEDLEYQIEKLKQDGCTLFG